MALTETEQAVYDLLNFTSVGFTKADLFILLKRTLLPLIRKTESDDAINSLRTKGVVVWESYRGFYLKSYNMDDIYTLYHKHENKEKIKQLDLITDGRIQIPRRYYGGVSSNHYRLRRNILKHGSLDLKELQKAIENDTKLQTKYYGLKNVYSEYIHLFSLKLPEAAVKNMDQTVLKKSLHYLVTLFNLKSFFEFHENIETMLRFLKPGDGDTPAFREALYEYALYTGNKELMQKAAEFLTPEFQLNELVLKGEYEQAFKGYNKILKTFGKKKDHFENISDVFYVLAYFSVHMQKPDFSIKLAKKLGNKNKLRHNLIFKSLSRAIACFTNFDQKLVDYYFSKTLLIYNDYQYPLLAYFFDELAFIFFKKLKSKEESRKSFARYDNENPFDRWMDSAKNIKWLNNNILSCLEDKDLKLQAEKYFKEAKQKPLLNVFSEQAKEDLALDYLLQLSGDMRHSETEERVCLFIDTQEDKTRMSFEVRVQKKTGSGYSDGRLCKDRDAVDSFKHLLDTDEFNAYGVILDNRAYYESSNFYVNLRTLRALSYIKNIYLLKDKNTPVKVEQSSVSLVTLKKDDRLEVAMLPQISLFRDDYYYTLKNATLKIYILDDKAKKIAEYMQGQTLSFDLHEEAKIQQLLTNLRQNFSISSNHTFLEENDPNLKKLSGKIRLHLTGEVEGMMLQTGAGDEEIEIDALPGKGDQYFTPANSDEPFIYVRDIEQEKVNYNLLKAEVSKLADPEWKDAYSWKVFEPEKALKLINFLHQNKDRFYITWQKESLLSRMRHIGIENIFYSMRQKTDWFDVQLGLTSDIDVDIEAVIAAAFRESSGQYEFGEQDYLVLSKDLKSFIRKLKSGAKEQKGDSFSFEEGMYFSLQDQLNQIDSLDIDEYWQKKIKDIQKIQGNKFKLPRDFKGELRDYQKQGTEWLNRLHALGLGACLADDMGLGKTVQVLACLLAQAKDGASLVVAPTSLLHNWESECRKFSPSLKPHILSSTQEIQAIKKTKAKDLFITSYGLLESLAKHMQDTEWNYIVADEAQMIKNAATKRFRALIKLSAKQKIALSGTPLENQLSDLWSIFRFINPGLLGNTKSFVKVFAAPIEKYKDDEQLEVLKHIIKPFLLRREKSEVLKELPPKTEINLGLDMPEKDKKLYEQNRLKAVAKLSDLDDSENEGSKHLKVLAELTKLRQIACSPRLVNPKFRTPGVKITEVVRIVENLLANKHKVLIYSQFVRFLALVREEFDGLKIDYAYLDGATNSKKRKSEIESFKHSKSVFLISLKAGGTGLNLTEADTVIHLDPWWNPAVENQASDRAHRIGQDKKVTVYRLICKDTIEDKIVDLHKEKKELANAVLAGGKAAAKMKVSDMVNLIQAGRD